jgi:hypothetical protein
MAKEAKDVPVAPKAYAAFALYFAALEFDRNYSIFFLSLHLCIYTTTQGINCYCSRCHTSIHSCLSAATATHRVNHVMSPYMCAFNFKQARPNISFVNACFFLSFALPCNVWRLKPLHPIGQQ